MQQLHPKICVKDWMTEKNWARLIGRDGTLDRGAPWNLLHNTMPNGNDKKLQVVKKVHDSTQHFVA